MEFLQTRIGGELANGALVLLKKMLKKRKQYVVYAMGNTVHVLEEELAKPGTRFVDKIYCDKGGVALIFEREV